MEIVLAMINSLSAMIGAGRPLETMTIDRDNGN
jgi:hypothetical protein